MEKYFADNPQKFLKNFSLKGFGCAIDREGCACVCGLVQVKVFQRPRVGVLSTGNEVVEPGRPLTSGQIYDSNRTTLMAAVTEQGVPPLDLGIATDE